MTTPYQEKWGLGWLLLLMWHQWRCAVWQARVAKTEITDRRIAYAYVVMRDYHEERYCALNAWRHASNQRGGVST